MSPVAAHQTETMIFFEWRPSFGIRFGASSLSSHCADHLRLPCRIHFSSHVMIRLRNGSFLLLMISEEQISNRQFCYFSLNSWDTRLSSFFTSSIVSRCRETVAVLTSSSAAISRTVFVGTASTNWGFQTVIITTGRTSAAAFIFEDHIFWLKLCKPTLYCAFVNHVFALCLINITSCLARFAA